MLQSGKWKERTSNFVRMPGSKELPSLPPMHVVGSPYAALPASEQPCLTAQESFHSNEPVMPTDDDAQWCKSPLGFPPHCPMKVWVQHLSSKASHTSAVMLLPQLAQWSPLAQYSEYLEPTLWPPTYTPVGQSA